MIDMFIPKCYTMCGTPPLWCSICEVIMNTREKFVIEDICNRPQPK